MTKKSKVYFIPVEEADKSALVVEKLKKLLSESKVLDFLSKDDKAAVKIHFGEEGNTGFVKPEYVKIICAAALGKGAKVFLADTNTLYKGRRTNSKDHLIIAAEHGFTKNNTGAEIVIPDDTSKENIIDLEINQKLIKTAKLVRFFCGSGCNYCGEPFQRAYYDWLWRGFKKSGNGVCQQER